MKQPSSPLRSALLGVSALAFLMIGCDTGVVSDVPLGVRHDPLEATASLAVLAPAVAQMLAEDPKAQDYFLDRAAERFDGATDVLFETMDRMDRGLRGSFSSRVSTYLTPRQADSRSLADIVAAVPDLTMELSLPPGVDVEDVRGLTLPVAAMRYDCDDAQINELVGHLPGGGTCSIRLDHPDPYILLSRNDRMDYLERGGLAASRALASPTSKVFLTGATMTDTKEFGSAPEVWLILGSASVFDPATSRILGRKDLVGFDKRNRWWECRVDLFQWANSAPEGAVIAMWFEDDPDWWWTQVQDFSIGFSVKNVSGEFSYELAEDGGGAKAIRANDDYMGDAVLYYEDVLPASYSTGNVSFAIDL